MTIATAFPSLPDASAAANSGVELGGSTRSSGSAPVEKNFTPLVRAFLDYHNLERHFSDYTVKS